MKIRRSRSVSFRGGVCSLVLACALLGVTVTAQDIDREFRFAEGLVALGFPDFAQQIVDRIVRDHPEQTTRAQLIGVRALIARGRIQEAETLIGGLPEGLQRATARLLLADQYYLRQRNDEAEAIYTDFFKNFAQRALRDEGVRGIFQESAYRFAQMQFQRGNISGALVAYEQVIASGPDKNLLLPLQAEMADLYVRLAQTQRGEEQKKSLQRARELCNKVFWEGPGLEFGNCVITLAYSYVVEGDDVRAQQTLSQYWDMLTRIENEMRRQGVSLARSPRAGARFLRGEILKRMGDKARNEDTALAHYRAAATDFANVFARYSTSKWAADAWSNIGVIRASTKDRFDREMRIDLSAMADQAADAMRQAARRLYQQGNIAGALPEYLAVVNAFPESGEVSDDLMYIANCFATLEMDLHAEMMIAHLTERYARNNVGARPLMALAGHYFNKGNEAMYLRAYEAYFEAFAGHERAPAILFTLAVARRRAGDMERNQKYLRRIVERYPRSSQYIDALEQFAWNSYEAEDFSAAAEAFKAYVAATTTPSPDRARGQFSLADSLMRLGKFAEAQEAYSELVTWLTPADNPYTRTTQDVIRNRDLLERSRFFIAFCLAQAEEPEGQKGVLRGKAMASLEQFMQDYPQSELIPRAYGLQGRIMLEMDRTDEAMQIFEQLASRYPDSDAGRSALFQLVRSSVQIGRMDVAMQALTQMMAEPETYGPDQLVRVGQWFLDEGEYEAAIRPYEVVLARETGDRRFQERALYGLGRALHEHGQHARVVPIMTQLMEQYPNSAFFYEARLLLARAHRELGEWEQATQALLDVFTYADGLLRNRADFELGQIRLAAGETRQALGSFLRIVYGGTTDTDSITVEPEMRRMVEESIYQCVVLYTQLKQYADVLEFAEMFLAHFSGSPRAAEVRGYRSEALLQTGR